MSRPALLLVFFSLAASACSGPDIGTLTSGAGTPRILTATAARERLARSLAIALADSGTRAAVKRRLDASNAPEGKLQFQALLRTETTGLLASLARAGASTPAELLADLDAAHGLELYLPVASQRAAWHGDANLLVGTAASDNDQPVGFDLEGARHLLDRSAPPATPVLALVPQETDFTRGHPERVMTCADFCGGDDNSNGGVYAEVTGAGTPGVYLVQSHFTEGFESWIKGSPEFEYHVYGTGSDGETVELACTGEQQMGRYQWNQDDLDWTGRALLFSDAEYNTYVARHPNSPVRIVAWEDDDEPCVDHADGNSIAAVITAVDNAYRALTSGKSDPWYIHGLKSASSAFNLIAAIHNVILTNDDFIGNGVDGSVTGDAPNGSNWVLKTEGTVTKGWFTTMRGN